MFVTLGCFQSPFRDISIAALEMLCATILPSQMKELRLKEVNFPAAQGGKGVCNRQICVMNLAFHSMAHVVSTLTGPHVSDYLPHPSVLPV